MRSFVRLNLRRRGVTIPGRRPCASRNDRLKCIRLCRGTDTSAASSWASKPKSAREETTWVTLVSCGNGLSDDGWSGGHCRCRPWRLPGRGIPAPGGLFGCYLPDQRRGASALSAPAFVQALDQGFRLREEPDVGPGEILPGPNH